MLGRTNTGGGGGGTALNFKVVGGTTAPSNPKENMIWVDTNTRITGYLFTQNNPNLLDFNLWANNISVEEGTKIVSDGAITLMSTGTDCRTGNSIPIPCKAGKTYIVEWDFSGNGDALFILPNNEYDGFVSVPSEAKKLEYTASEDATFLALRVDVGSAPGESGTYSNIRIYEKGQKVMPGTVWIATGTSSPVAFNALKKNGIQVYPISAKQCVGGAWVTKTAKSYLGGKWVDWWNGELFDNGNQFESITGGWIKKSGMKSYDNNNTGTATVGNTLHIASSSGKASVLTTQKKIDVTKFSTMKIYATNNNGALLSLHTFEAGNINQGTMIKWLTAGENVLDLTEPGEYYVSVGANSGNGCDVSKIKMY